jgi:hypothetical protein
MSWRLKTSLLVALMLCITLPLKLAMKQPSIEFDADATAKTDLVMAFLVRQQAGAIRPVKPLVHYPQWLGWHFTSGTCEAVALPDLDGPDWQVIDPMLRAPRQQTVYLFHGASSPTYPVLRWGLDRVWMRTQMAFHQTRWHTPFLVILTFSGDCEHVLRWNWSLA